jgi:hypothetical protein
LFLEKIVPDPASPNLRSNLVSLLKGKAETLTDSRAVANAERLMKVLMALHTVVQIREDISKSPLCQVG